MSRSNTFLLLFVFGLFTVYAFGYDWYYDEAWSYQAVGDSSVEGIITYSPYHYANNHLINSLWLKLIQYTGIHSLVVYRILSLLSGLVFLYFTFLLFDEKKIAKWKYLALAFGPYLVFFSQARGYSLSLATLAAAIYIISKRRDSLTIKYILLLTACLSISTLANFSFVFFNTSMLIILGSRLLSKGKLKHVLAIAAIYTVPLVYTIYIGSSISLSDIHIIGSSSFLDTPLELIGQLAFAQTWGIFGISKWPIIVTTILLLIACSSLLSLLREESHLLRLLIYTLLLSALMLILSHYVAGSAYPQSRATLVYAYGILLLWVLSSEGLKWRIPQHIALGIFILNGVFHATYHIYDLSRPSVRETVLDAHQQNNSVGYWGYNAAYLQIAREEHLTIYQDYDVSALENKLWSSGKAQHRLVVKTPYLKEISLISHRVIETKRLRRNTSLLILQKAD